MLHYRPHVRPLLFFSRSSVVPSSNYLRLLQGLWIADFSQTFPVEVDIVWPGKVTGTKIIYLFNRYAFGISMLLQAISVLPGSTSETG